MRHPPRLIRRLGLTPWGWACLFAAALALGALTGTVRADEHEEAPRWRPSTRSEVRAVLVDAAERHGVSAAVVVAVASCESDLHPGAVGRAGELGLFQLHPAGLLPAFYRLGYDDPWSVWQQGDFAARMFAGGMARHWSCWWTTVAGRNPPWWR